MKNVPKLADPENRHVKRALRIKCPSCGAMPGQRCKALYYRIVHFARVEMKP